MSDSVWRLPFEGTRIAVLADCHIRQDGQEFPPALFPRLQDADLIVTLGGMGVRAGLDRLEEIAPVLGVCGADDEGDLRTRRTTLVLEGGGYRIGCVPDAGAAGLAKSVDPFVPVANFAERCRVLFGGTLDLLLHANTGRADEALLGPLSAALNPGSPVQPADGARPSFLRLLVGREGCFGQMIWVA